MKRTLRERLLAKIDQTGLEPHWFWTGTFDPNRPRRQKRKFIRLSGQPTYVAMRTPRPVMVVDGKKRLVTRLVWLEFCNPELPDAVFVMRLPKCRFHDCVSPHCHHTPPRLMAGGSRVAFVPPTLSNTPDDDIADLAFMIKADYETRDPDELAALLPSYTRAEIVKALAMPD